MQLAKRIAIFLLVNVLIMLTATVVLQVLGVEPYLNASGLNYKALAVFCLIWGFAGAFVSLGLSRILAKWMMGVKLVDADSHDSSQRWLVETVSRISFQAGLKKVPQIGIYESPEINAFATGPSKSRSLVAVSTGLLHSMSRDEAEAVLAHEVAHVANGDMVTMTLVQGVVNAFVMFFARVVAWSVSQMVDEDKRGMVNFISVIVFQIVFSLLGMVVVAWFSRLREFRADAGAAQLVGAHKMAAALRALQANAAGLQAPSEGMATMQISSARKGGLLALFSTHPPLEERIARLNVAGSFSAHSSSAPRL